MKSLITFSHVLLDEVGQRCGVSTARDRLTLSRRIEHEGISFLTISLPAYCKDFESSLANGRVEHDQFTGLARTGSLPRFLGGFFALVFDLRTGSLLDYPSIDAIRCLRQFLMAFAKINLPCSDAREKAAFDRFIECEKEIRDIRVDEGDLTEFSRISSLMFSDIFTELNRQVLQGELLPKHGPGSTADHLVGNEKYSQSSWTERLEPHFPAGEFLFPNWGWWQELQSVDFLEPGSEVPVRVISVPKTLKTPRIIAIEPACMQYAQQALARQLVQLVEGDDILSGLIGFTDQLPNRKMAREGSMLLNLATLDLSEASDRVSNLHVIALFKSFPALSSAVQACRSTKADVRGHGVVPLAKFASMGSALCFPVEAMVFMTIVLVGIQKSTGLRLTRAHLRALRGKVRIYGDDIIVPINSAPSVARSLEDFGLKVNSTKSFRTGKFRESCGGDYYNGEWVTPIRVRELFPASLKQVDRIESTVSLRNQLFEAGWSMTVDWLDKLISKVLPLYPLVPLDSPILGRHTFDPIEPGRMCPSLYRPLIKGCISDSPIPLSGLDDYGALMKFFLERGPVPLSTKSFTHAGRPVSARIKTRWVPMFAWGLES